MAIMNINYPTMRGCWIDKELNDKKEVIKATVYDYPTWRNNNGDYTIGSLNSPIPKDKINKMVFNSLNEAIKFCKEEHYVICDRPKTKKEREAIMAKYGNQFIAEEEFNEEDKNW